MAVYSFVGKFGSAGSGDGQFNYVKRVASYGNYILVAEANSPSRVQIFDRSTLAFVANLGVGTQGSGAGQFNSPYGIACNSQYIAIVESDNHRTQFFNKNTRAYAGINGSYGSEDWDFNSPRDIAIDEVDIVVADRNNNRITIWDATNIGQGGIYKSKITGLIWPQAVAIDSTSIYASDGTSIQIFSRSTLAQTGEIGFDGFVTYGICVKGSLIYVANFTNKKIYIYNKVSLTKVGEIGSAGTGDGQFQAPVDVFVDGYNVYVADAVNARVQLFTAPCTPPIISPDGGSFTPSVNVSLTSPENLAMRYTIDGSTPSDTAGIIYTDPVRISESLTIKAVAYSNATPPTHGVSEVASAAFTIAGRPKQEALQLPRKNSILLADITLKNGGPTLHFSTRNIKVPE